jgi:hypothetical protein
MNLKTLPELGRLSPLARRRFLKQLSVALAAPAIPAGLRHAVNDFLVGPAHADEIEASLPTYFIEFNYRDQVDFGEVAIAPSLAAGYASLNRGDTGRRAALFFDQSEIIEAGNNFFLTPDSQALAPHLDSIAFLDSGELTPGQIHGHNAANRNRAPDCSTSAGPGQSPMWTRDPTTQFPTGVEAYQSAFPTPASLHNYLQKSLTPEVRNGVVMKGVTRAKHTIFHFGANLPGSELDRMQEKDQLYSAFPGAGEPGVVAPVSNLEEAELLARVLKRIDPAFLARRNFAQTAFDSHMAEVTAAQGILSGAGAALPGFELPLTAEEDAYWKEGVPEQGDDGRTVFDGIMQDNDTLTHVKFQIWEQFALAYKLIAGGFTRTVAGDCEFIDHHETRPRANVKVQTLQVALPLARLIEQLKAVGLYDRTLIAIYTCDGSRAPAANSNGDDEMSKMSIILAGGLIRGGYYGDIRVGGPDGDGHQYAIHMPDLSTGLPVPTGSMRKNEGRIPGSVMWKTVAKAMRAPASMIGQFPGMAEAQTLDFLLNC